MARAIPDRHAHRAVRPLHSPSAAGDARKRNRRSGDARIDGHAVGNVVAVSGRCHSSSANIALGLAILASGTIATYVLTYLTTFATTTLKMRTDVAFGATIIIGLSDVCLAPIGGHLSDILGRKPLIVAPWALLFVLVMPAFVLITRVPSSTTLLAATAGLAMLRSLALGPVIVSLTESLPPRSRSGSLAITYAVAIGFFGGTAQFIVAWLTDVTGNPPAPAWYMTVAVGVGLAAVGAAQRAGSGLAHPVQRVAS